MFGNKHCRYNEGPLYCTLYSTVELHWFEPWWLVYPAWLELVLGSLWSHKWDICGQLSAFVFLCCYSRLALSRLRLSRITAYLEEKIWSLFLHRNLKSGNKILWIRGKNAPQEQFLPFSTIFSTYISNLRSQITCSLMKFGCLIGIFLNPAHLICRGTDISQCFRGSLRLRDNESRLYFHFFILMPTRKDWPQRSHIWDYGPWSSGLYRNNPWMAGTTFYSN